MIGKGLLWAAARRILQNPEVQQRATDIAAEAYTRAKPTLENAGRQISESMRDAAAEHDPMQDPIGFVKSLKKKRFRRRIGADRLGLVAYGVGYSDDNV